MFNLSNEAKKIVQQFAERLPVDERERLLFDLDHSTVNLVEGSNALVNFEISDYSRPLFKGQRPYQVEGKVNDQDGSDLDVLLHKDENGRLLELEIVRYDDGIVIDPDWRTLRFL